MQNIKYNEYHIRALLLRDDIDFNKFTRLELIDFLNVSIKDNEMNKKQLKSKKEINKKAIEYIKENKEKYYQDWGQDDGSVDTYLDENEVKELLQILGDKEVSK